MLIQNFASCQHRLPGMPFIGCDPGCALTSMEKPCDNPTYETCPRYTAVKAHCASCGDELHGFPELYRDEVDWTLVCPRCGTEWPASTVLPDKPWGHSPAQAVSG